ncbi:hypothetical protein B0J13DRAFT_676212 [Dactylonectria estremocensis]|uniref:Methyltransferase type 11 domain-containing protein n=1 Tax=Dactylonectria estremocensis TaxID=1079267 RepID=A0A9P9J3Z6_9HYPO|nr:hypothetical protein B0J13DRAFT_676212 [Dactylonectria estremocensis]
MFDVIWTDPDRELVGERRAKKELKREQLAKGKEKPIPTRSYLSPRSSRSSTDSPFGFLRSRGLKQSISDRAIPEATGLLTPSLISSRSPRSIDSDVESHANSGHVADGSSMYMDPVRVISGKSFTLPADSSQLVQTLGPSSFVTKRTEVSWKPRSSDPKNDLLSEILISSKPETDQPMAPSSPQRHSNVPVPLLRSDSSVISVPEVKVLVQLETPQTLFSMPTNLDAWRAPQEWDCSSAEPDSIITSLENTISAMLQINDESHADESSADNSNVDNGNYRNSTHKNSGSNNNNKSTEISSDLNTLQKEVRRMVVASPEVVLSRLKETWDTTEDMSLQHELELEKKYWMLSTLQHLDPIPRRDSSSSPVVAEQPTDAKRILALYESQAITSYLAAVHPKKKIYHMAATPLSHTRFPNIHPVLVPSVSPSVFPVAPRLFENVYSLSMPSTCAAPDIPGVLKNIRKSLKQGGSLHLTLIDPLPCAGTLGQHMRTWLEEHLLLNLERRFRCMTPSRLFPDWLAEASLRGRGSTLSMARFFANPASVRYLEGDSDPFVEQASNENQVKAELRSLVGRMLWMEVWGSFVTTDKWWWEDEQCVQECLELGTIWEYKIIQGVRGD